MAGEILRKSGLLIDTAKSGTAAFAYYIDMVPKYWEQHPMVIFDIDEKYVMRVEAPLVNKKPNYAYMKMPGTVFNYIPITVLGFLNVPWFISYPSTGVGFF